MIHIALVDGSESDRQGLERALREYAAIHRVEARFFHFADGESFLKVFAPYRFRAVFLEVLLPGMSGIDAARAVREQDDGAAIVFVTHSGAHMAEAFSVFADSYLQKPCDPETLRRTLDHMFRRRTGPEPRFFFSFERKDHSLPFSELVSLEADGNYLSLTDRSGRRYRTRMTFSAAAEKLDGRFLTLQKGIAVNMDHILRIGEGRCEVRGGAIFPLHVKHRKDLLWTYQNYRAARSANGRSAG